MNCFNPEDYDDDIVVVDMQSLGRGRGFKKIAEYSALGDQELTGRIAARLEQLLKVIEGEHKETEKEHIEDLVEELEDENQALKAELVRTGERIQELESNPESEAFGELLSRVNAALSDTYHEDFEELETAIGALIDEYHDAVEEAEDLI